ncbi:MAG TPA: ABC transporter ATP-binding protein [Ignavibacteria bacterium]|nr:ABC transporter ATP-binding protein [Ignavibacteria bacterium]
MSFLEIKNVNKSFETKKVLDNISLSINKGEFFSIVGPSGCGKTTLLRIIAGLETATSGDIVLNGENISKKSPQERDIGIVFQNYALFPHMTVFENVAYGLKIKKESKETIRKKVYDVLEKVKLTDKTDVRVTNLSGGEQQRVSLARVIVIEPKVILFDEPLSNLDYILRLETRGEIKRLQKETGITSVYVTHDQSEALALSDRIAVLSKGVLQQLGNPIDVYYNPVNYFVADFICHANFFNAEESNKFFGLNIENNKNLVVLPEELFLSNENVNQDLIISDIQFNGLTTEYFIKYGDKFFRSFMVSKSGNHFKIGDAVGISIPQNLNRKVLIA